MQEQQELAEKRRKAEEESKLAKEKEEAEKKADKEIDDKFNAMEGELDALDLVKGQGGKSDEAFKEDKTMSDINTVERDEEWEKEVQEDLFSSGRRRRRKSKVL